MHQEVARRFFRLAQFLGGYLNEDWPEDHGTPECAIDFAIEEYPLEWLQEARRQLVMLLEETNDDRELCAIFNDGIGVCVRFERPDDCRAFAESIEGKLMASIRAYFEGASGQI